LVCWNCCRKPQNPGVGTRTCLPRLGRRATWSPEVTPWQWERKEPGWVCCGGCWWPAELLSECQRRARRGVLAAEGCEVVAPPEQPCCGAFWWARGQKESGGRVLELANIRTIDACGQKRERTSRDGSSPRAPLSFRVGRVQRGKEYGPTCSELIRITTQRAKSCVAGPRVKTSAKVLSENAKVAAPHGKGG